MMVVEKNGIKITVRDDNQLVAFLNNGWQNIEAEKVSFQEEIKEASGTGKMKNHSNRN